MSRPTRKSILNLTSRKKRNGMLSISNTTSTGLTGTIGPGAGFVNARDGGRFLWCPTAMELRDPSGSAPTIGLEALRTATTCFMRGLSEHVRIQTSSGLPWFWRRICFTSKGPTFIQASTSDTPIQSPTPYRETSNGMQRLWLNQNINTMNNTINNREGVIFKGASGVDWDELIEAPLDPRRITIKYDKTITIRSGNANGAVLDRKLWHGMNKSLVYDDDESGISETTGFVSTDSKAGMGDYYILDIFDAGAGGTATDLLRVTSNSTLYWHER